MLNVRLAGGHLYGKQLFTWLSLVVSVMASFCSVFFPLYILDEICDLIVSVSEEFLTYPSIEHSLSLSSAHGPDMTEILLKRNKNRISSNLIHSTIFILSVKD